jgi:hypothetical protein
MRELADLLVIAIVLVVLIALPLLVGGLWTVRAFRRETLSMRELCAVAVYWTSLFVIAHFLPGVQ